MSEARFDVEALLRTALTPVEPPETLSDRLERNLTELLASLNELVGAVPLGERPGVVEVRLRAT